MTAVDRGLAGCLGEIKPGSAAAAVAAPSKGKPTASGDDPWTSRTDGRSGWPDDLASLLDLIRMDRTRVSEMISERRSTVGI